MKKKFSKGLAVFLAFLMTLTGISLSPATANAAGGYVSDSWSVKDIMQKFGAVVFDTANIDTHFHSNFLVETLDQIQDSGIRKSYQIQEDFYFAQATNLSSNMSEYELDRIYTLAEVNQFDANRVQVTLVGGGTKVIDSPRDIYTKTDYANMDTIKNQMVTYNRWLAAVPNTGGATMTVDANSASKKYFNVTSSEPIVVYNLKASDIASTDAGGTNIFFTFNDYDADQTLILNIDMKDFDSSKYKFPALLLGAENNTFASAESNVTKNYNKMFYNLYDSSKDDLQYDGDITFGGARGFGTVFAPNANVVLENNWDGSVVCGVLTNNGQFHRVNVAVIPEFTSIVGIKVDGDGNALAGAKFGLYTKQDCSEDPIQTAISGTDGKFVFDGIYASSAATYYVKEIEAPNGYVLSATVYPVSIEKGNTNPVYVNNGAGIKNEKPFTGSFSKISTVTSKELPGAQITLKADVDISGVKRVSGPDIVLNTADKTISWTSGTTELVLTDLPAGTFTMTENVAPATYNKAESITFTVGTDGKFYQDGKIIDKNRVVMEDKPIINGSFSKLSVASGAELSGAEITLTADVDLSKVERVSGPSITYGNDKKSISWVSGSSVLKLTNLPAGTYTMTEVTAPDGYEKAESIKFTVKNDGKFYNGNTVITDNKIVMKDYPTPTIGKFSKSAVSSTGEVTGALAGAHLSLTADVDISNVVRIAGPGIEHDDNKTISWITGTISLELSGLPAGHYTLTETQAPNGYKIAESIKFIVGDDDCFYRDDADKTPIKDNHIEMVDAHEDIAKGSFSKTSTASTGELEGAKITLTADVDLSGVKRTAGPDIQLSNNNKTISWTSGTTALSLTGLPAGKYTLTETTAPAGYAVAESISFTVKNDGKFYDGNTVITDNKIVMKDAPIKGTFSKTSTASTAELEGAEITLTADVDLSGVIKVSGPDILPGTSNKSINWTSGKEALVLSMLPAGTYEMTEVTAPNGYSVAESIKFTVGIDGKFYNGTTVITDNKIVMKDKPIDTANGTFSKVSTASTGELPGAKLELTADVDLSSVACLTGQAITLSADKKTISWTSSTTEVKLSGLPKGSYTLTETTAPAGYEVAESIKFTVGDGGKFYNGTTEITDNKIVMKDAPIEGTFSKVSTASTGELSGAKLELTADVDLSGVVSKSGPAITLSTDKKTVSWTSGTAAEVLSKLPAGSYTLTETTAPDGYAVAESIKFTVGTDGKFYDGTTEISDNKIVMKDAPIKGTFSKVSTASTGELSGAKLELTADVDLSGVSSVSGPAITLSTDKKTVSWTSGTAAEVLSKLPAGSYTLTETTAPNGYAVAESIKFTVGTDGKFYDGTTVITDNKIVMKDAPIKGTFSKTSTASTAELEGAEITLKADVDLSGVSSVSGPAITLSADKKSVSWTSGTVAEVLTNLPAGKYEMTEVTAPNGYDVAETIKFTVGTDGKFYNGTTVITDNKIVMKDKPINTANGSFSKTSTSSTGELAGAKIELTADVDLSGVGRVSGPAITLSTDKKTISWTSSTTELKLSGLPVGSYTMTETTAPAGYAVAESIKFTVADGGVIKNANGNVITDNKIVMKDAPIDGSFSKRAVSSTGELLGTLAGAKLTLTADVDLSGVKRVSGSNIQLSGDKKSISWTSGSGELKLSALPAGKYTLTETTAPNGYAVAESISFTVGTDGKFYDGTTVITDNKIVMKDAPINGTFSKVSTASTDELAGAKIELTANVSLSGVGRVSGPAIAFSNGNKTISWTSGSESLVLTKLPAGTYTMTETTAPNGYTVAESIKFTVGTDGKFYDGTTVITDNKIVMKDAPIVGNFSKTSVTSTAELAGATLVLTSSVSLAEVSRVSGPAIEYTVASNSIKWVSGTEKLVLSKLPAGSYTMTEYTAPNGYKVAEPINFVVNGDGKFYIGTVEIADKTIVMEDKPNDGSGVFSKTAVATTGELIGTLSGAKLELTADVDLSTVGRVSGPEITLSNGNKTISWVTGNEELMLSGLPEGSYTLKEITAPDGYEVAEDIKFTVDADGKLLDVNGQVITDNHIDMKDTALSASGAFSKSAVSEGGENLGALVGAKLELRSSVELTGVVRLDGPDIEISADKKTIKWTSGDKELKLSGLPAGTYEMVETYAPAGYTVADPIKFTVTADGKFYDANGDLIADNRIKMEDISLSDPGNGGNGGNNGNGGNGGNGNGGNGNGGNGNGGNGNGGNGNGGNGNGGNGNGGNGNGGNGNGGSGNGGNGGSGTGTNAPKTGDGFVPFIWIAVIAACVGVISFLVVRGRKIAKKKERIDR